MEHTIQKQFIAQFLPENPRIIEAGAHIGRDTAKLARQWPQGHVYAFEPVPELYAQLQERTQPLANVSTYNIAISNSLGMKTFYKSSGRSTATSSLFKPKEYAEEFPDTLFEITNIACTTFDIWARENSIPPIDFMWLDMQGGELHALQGAASLLPDMSAIYTEVALSERYEQNPLYKELTAFLKTYNFYPHTEALGKITWGNVLFLKAK